MRVVCVRVCVFALLLLLLLVNSQPFVDPASSTEGLVLVDGVSRPLLMGSTGSPLGPGSCVSSQYCVVAASTSEGPGLLMVFPNEVDDFYLAPERERDRDDSFLVGLAMIGGGGSVIAQVVQNFCEN